MPGETTETTEEDLILPPLTESDTRAIRAAIEGVQEIIDQRYCRTPLSQRAVEAARETLRGLSSLASGELLTLADAQLPWDLPVPYGCGGGKVIPVWFPLREFETKGRIMTDEDSLSFAVLRGYFTQVTESLFGEPGGVPWRVFRKDSAASQASRMGAEVYQNYFKTKMEQIDMYLAYGGSHRNPLYATWHILRPTEAVVNSISSRGESTNVNLSTTYM